MTQPLIVADQIDRESLFTVNGTYVWDDMLTSLSSGKTTTANDPAWAQFRDGLYAYSFSNTTLNEIWLTFHVPHNYAPGTDMWPHIHWATTGTNTGVVRWGIEYTVAKGYSQEIFPTSTTIYLEDNANATARMHQITECSAGQVIPSSMLEPDALVLLRIFRDGSHANDTCTNAAFGLACDLHYQRAAAGTVNRNYPFS